MQSPLAVIGDVHGEAGRLEYILTKLQGRRLILVGDYINRGNDPKQVLGQLIELEKSRRETVFLRGNHEESFLAYLAGDLPLHKFAAMGGLATIKSYLPLAKKCVREELLAVFPQSHRRFLDTCIDYFEDSEIIVSHCGIDPKNPTGRVKADMVSRSHKELFSGELVLSKLVICGHYTQALRRPYVNHNVICVDTGSGVSTRALAPQAAY